jgi:diguanylate cyclase
VENSSFSYAPDLQCSISIGIAQPDNEAGLREWLEVADRALYRAKHAGRNRTASRDASPEEETAIP